MLNKNDHILQRMAALTLLLSFMSCCACAQDWHLKKDEDGIKVFTANATNSDFKTIKVECTVSARPSQVVALLMDIQRQHEWVYNSKSAELVKVLGANEFIFYSQVSVPWPCADRDYIAHITVTQPSPELITIDSRSEPDMLPVKSGKVRVRKSMAHWAMTSLGKDLIKIVYTVSFDPAGTVPAWLTNMFVTKGPFQTFQQLRDRVKLPVYKDAHFDFIKE